MSNPAKQPTLFEVFGRHQSTVVPEVNEKALSRLTDVLTESSDEVGKVVLLRSPRAGYGKTLLLQAAHSRLNEGFRFLAVEPSGGGRIDGEVVLESVVRQLSEVLPASGGLTEFDLFARRLLALGLKPLLISGEIPSHDREGALFAVENRPIETFDFHHQQALTAHWTQSNFEVLGPRLTSELSELSGSSLRGCAYWIDLLFRYATTSPEKVERTRHLSDAIFGDLKGQASSLAEERLQSLLTLLGLNEPIVLVFDETEGLSNQPESGLRVAAFIVQLRQACPALTVIFSLNEDVWETGLTPLMPGGLEDRLTEFEVLLDALSREDGESLLKSRFGDAAEKISKNMSWPEPIFARAILKEGAKIARQLTAEGTLVPESSFSLESSAASILPKSFDTVVSEPESEPIADTFQEKAEQVLEQKMSLEPEAKPAVDFGAVSSDSQSVNVTAKEEASVEIKEPTAPTAGVSSDPFAEVKVASGSVTSSSVAPESEVSESPVEASPTSPFEIASKGADTGTQPVPEKIKSPFEAVEDDFAVVAESEPPSQGWSAEKAVDGFVNQDATGATSSPTESAFQSSAQSAEDAGAQFLRAAAEEQKQFVPATEEPAPEPQQPFKAASPEPVKQAEQSPFAISEPVAEPRPAPQAAPSQAVPPQLPPENPTSPFSVAANEANPRVVSQEVANSTSYPVGSDSAPVAARAADPFAPAEVVQTPPQGQPSAEVSLSAQAPSQYQAPVQPQEPVRASAAVPQSEPVQSRPVQESASVPVATSRQVVSEQNLRTAAVVEPVVEEVKAPVSSEPIQRGQSPFSSAPPELPQPTQSPFAAAAEQAPSVGEASVDGKDSSEVEELLSQFKQRFGQKGS